MKLISHRGNIIGKNISMENKISHIQRALDNGYDVEIDIWYIKGNFFLGHDNPLYEVAELWLLLRSDNLWLHCKNLDAIVYFNDSNKNHPNSNRKYHYFWHQEDTITLTSSGYIWAYPGNQPIKNSIAVLPERCNDILGDCMGICSDEIVKYKNESK